MPPQEEEAPAKKSSSLPLSNSTVIFFALLLMVIVAKFGAAEAVRSGAATHFISDIFHLRFLSPEIRSSLKHLGIVYILFINIFCFFLAMATLFSLLKLRKIEIEWRQMLYPSPHLPEDIAVKNEKWERVMSHIASDNPSDWRLAILEADIVLDELLDHLGYFGDTIGDRMKKIAKGDFQTLDQAWEAHKIRNAIAHEGQDFVLTQREARRIIGLYEVVFREFDFI